MLIGKKSPHGGYHVNCHDILDFSANLNPAGMPDCVKRALSDSVKDCGEYPDPYCMNLRKAISKYEAVPVGCILCGNGATELIYSYAFSLPKRRKALIVSPSFSEYETALDAAGLKVEHYVLTSDNGFNLTEDILETDLSSFSSVFLCTPNNPIGVSVQPAVLEKIARTGVRVFADMCFLDLTCDPDRYDISDLIRTYPNVTVLRAFTKNFAMAGVRLGYVISSDSAILEKMSSKAPCWNVSYIAQNAGIAAAGCRQWLRKTVEQMSVERERVSKSLMDMGVRVFPSEANYLLLYLEQNSGCGLPDRLAEKGILVRDCSDYVGLGKGYFRIAIRTKTENDRLLSAVREVLS